MTIDSTLRDVQHLIEKLPPEQAQLLDQWSEPLQGWMHSLVEQGGPAARRVKNWLNGVWLGHPVHPALTDLTIGAWCTGFVLDVLGSRRSADAAHLLGVIAAVPTGLSGAADWSDTSDAPRRNGLLHALLNSLGVTCMVASLFARRAEQRAIGIGLSTCGLTLATLSAWIGGELVFRQGTGVNRNAWSPSFDGCRAVLSADLLVPGKLVAASLSVDGVNVPLVLLKKGRSVLALHGTCSHWGGPLAEGKLLDGECVECPWHGSQFSLSDGSVLQGPATAPQPVFEARIRNGQVEVRRKLAAN